MATYSVVAIGTAVKGAGTLTPAPGTHVAGDLLVLLAGARTVSEVRNVDPAGYSVLGSSSAFDILGKIATSSSEGAVSVSFDGTSLCSAQIVTLRSSTGWPDLGSIIVDSHLANNNVTGARYQDINPSLSGLLVFLAQCKATITANVNAATGVAVTSGYTAAGFAANNDASTGMFLCAQVIGQTTATNIADINELVTGNTDTGAARGISLTFQPATGGLPSITSVGGDNSVTNNETNVPIVGANLGTVTGTVTLISGAITRAQSIDSWANTAVQIDIVQGNIPNGDCTLRLTLPGGATADKTITLVAPSGYATTTLGALRALTYDDVNMPSRLYSSPDIVANAQIEYTNTYTIESDGVIDWATATKVLLWRFHNGTVWSTQFQWDTRGKPPRVVGTIVDQTFTASALITPVDHSVAFQDADSTLTYSIIGTLPGTSLNTTTGIETGTPVTPVTTTGLYTRATDEDGTYVDAGPYSRMIQAAPNPPFFTGTIPTVVATVGTTALFDVTSYFAFISSYSVTGTLPPGVSFNAGLFSGAYTTEGTYPVSVRGTGTGTPADSNTFNFDVRINVVTVPTVVGIVLATAQATLEALGLVVTSVSAVSDLPEGQVSAQSIIPDTEVAVGTAIVLTVSVHDGIVIPYLIGDPEALARSRIAALRLVANVTGSGGSVVSQSPEFMSLVNRGSTVNITVGGPIYNPTGSRRRRRGLPPYTGRGT